MNKRIAFTLILAGLLTSGMAFSQEGKLLLRSGEYPVQQTSQTEWSESEVINGHFYRIIAFDNIPTTEEKNELKKAGITLLDYLPKNAFYASINTSVNWSALSGATILPIKNEFKQSKILSSGEYPHWTLFGTDQIELTGFYFTGINREVLLDQLSSVGATLVQIKEQTATLNLRVRLEKLDDLYALPAFYYFETIASEGEPENLSGRTNHRSNTLWTEYSGGLSYNGDSVTVMMQDDGIIGPHIDYTGRIDQSNCIGCSTDPTDTHGDHVSGTIMGAGNLDPANRGMAHGAELLVYSSSNNNYDVVPSLVDNQGLVITSKSYSNGCNDGYTSLARQLDQQVRQRPNLTHVFSAGNSGTSDCGYGAGAGWGNITGGHKVGKNVIAVGALSQYDVLASFSSRGPAEDGRIKPDICGVGTAVTSTGPDNIYFSSQGTSMSCPGVSGTIAQLYQGYRDLNGGTDPDAALIKASILNTGEDLGNSGPDFQYGWGRINARSAFETMSNNQYIQGSISQGATDQHTINVPAGVDQLRIMVYWTDYEGSTAAAIALVNDLNLVVTDPSLQAYDPWVLDHTPNAAALDAPAVRAVDALNNMEQVTIDSPVAGSYDVSINGFAVPQGPQDYYIVYYFVRSEITVTYPIGGEGIVPSGGHVVRWDASEGTDPFTIEYSTDNGSTWTVDGTANADQRYYTWITPNVVSGLAKVRVTRNGISDESDAVFSIIGTPTNLSFDWICPDSCSLTWNAVTGATAYEVSMLGAKYMDSIGVSAATNFTIQVPSSNDGWFSVRALGPDDARGERAVAIQKDPGEFNCSWSTPYANFDVDCPSAGTGHCFDMIDASVNTNASTTYTWYFPGGTPATSNDPTPTVCYSTPGDYDIALVVDNGSGIDSIYTANAVSVIATPGLPYFEGFESYTTFTNIDEWSTYNPDNNQTFYVTTNAALSGTKSARLSNYSQFGNFTDELISGPIDLSTLSPTDIMTLSFRYSYRKKIASNDEWLRVYVTQGCEDSWVVRKTMHGDMLSPLTTISSWTPSSESDWTTVHMTNITDLYFTGDFRMKFSFESDNGNNFYLDNINLYEGGPSDQIIAAGIEEHELGELTLYPNPASDELNVSFTLNGAQKTMLSIVDITGKTIDSYTVNGQSGSNLAMLDVADLAPGVYILKVTTGTTDQQLRFVIQ